MTGFHIQDAHSVFFRHYNRQITVAFTLQIVNLTKEQSNSRTVEQYNDTPKENMAVVDSMFYFIMNRSRNSS